MYKPIRIEKKRIADLERATYNPRVDLQPGDEDFEAINGSLARFGMVQPIVWNQRTNRVVGGHQRLTSEEYRGETEVYAHFAPSEMNISSAAISMPWSWKSHFAAFSRRNA